MVCVSGFSGTRVCVRTVADLYVSVRKGIRYDCSCFRRVVCEPCQKSECECSNKRVCQVLICISVQMIY